MWTVGVELFLRMTFLGTIMGEDGELVISTSLQVCSIILMSLQKSGESLELVRDIKEENEVV